MSLVCPKLWRNDHFERLLAPDILNVNKYEAMSSLVSLWEDQGGCGTLSWGSFYAKQKPLKNHSRPKWRMLLEKTRVVTYVAGTGHICIWWCDCTDHKFLAGPSVSPPASIFFLFTSLFPSPLSLPPPPFVSACPMNQSGWQCAAVREPVRVITHVELGQDLDGQSWQQERRDSGRFHQSNSCPLLSFTFSFFSQCLWSIGGGVKRRSQTSR